VRRDQSSGDIDMDEVANGWEVSSGLTQADSLDNSEIARLTVHDQARSLRAQLLAKMLQRNLDTLVKKLLILPAELVAAISAAAVQQNPYPRERSRRRRQPEA